MAATNIEWCDHSINTLRARVTATNAVGHYCEKVSPGCANCYASTLQKRFGGLPYDSGQHRNKVGLFLDPSKLQEVLRRQKPTHYFWCDMTDLFGEWVPEEWIDQCFAVMALTPQHTHMVLTKRPGRMLHYLTAKGKHNNLEVTADALLPGKGHPSFGGKHLLPNLPLPNVWLGVSVEDQQRADERIPLLLQAPAAVRFLSCEPLLGAVDLTHVVWPGKAAPRSGGTQPHRVDVLRLGYWDEVWGFVNHSDMHDFTGPISWVIVGGESGPGSRPCRVEWVRSIVEQCRAAGVACFVKQLGSRPNTGPRDAEEGFFPRCHLCGHHDFGPCGDGTLLCNGCDAAWGQALRDRKGGDPEEWPADLRVRQFPEVSRT